MKANYLKLNIKSRIRLGKRFFYHGERFSFLKTYKPYAIDLYPGIWNKSFAEETIRKWPFSERTIWDYEGKFDRLSHFMQLNNCYCYCGKKFPFEDVVRKGKILRKAQKILLKQYGYDLSKNRPIMTRNEYFLDKVIPFLSRILPCNLKKRIKIRLERKGKKFYS